jgi:two-component system cell cycle response regulator DivK
MTWNLPTPGVDRSRPPLTDWRVNHRSPLVLVVEDHADTRAMLKILLELYGCRVIEADNGEAAVQAALSKRPDLILMDVSLPVVDGLTATRRIREWPSLSRVPIVAVTGHARAQDRVEALAAGCDECMVKPIDFDRLEELIEQLPVPDDTLSFQHSKYSLALRSNGVLACLPK